MRRVGVNEDVVLIGGLALNPGFMAAMTEQLKVSRIHSPQEPEFGAAVGAAVSATEESR
jgi:benzoyl-CoA reductase subunit D